MNFWSPKTLKSLVLPGGIFLLAASVVFRGAFGPIPSAAVVFSFYAVFAAGILLAWRFHSSRILFALATLFLGSPRAGIFFFGPDHFRWTRRGSPSKPWPFCCR